MVYLIFMILQLLFKDTTCMVSSKELEGYPMGYLSDCPGTNIYTEIPEKELSFITISVVPRLGTFRSKAVYNYYQVKELAKDPDVDFTKPTVMFVTGYLDQPNFPIGISVGSVYKKLGYTVLLLYARVFRNTDYIRASRNTRPVGKHTAEMLTNLTYYGLDPKKLSLVGLSLGGHTVSFIAKSFRELTGVNISRITGLDPAGPCFRNLGPEDRLDQTDADFVDVVMTNIDVYGMAAPMGHVNFYVNGGEYQPGDIIWLPCTTFCSHIRSYTLWIAALNSPKKFIAIKCDSIQEARNRSCFDNKPLITNILGLNTDRNIKGIFYLATDSNYPYYLGKDGLKWENEIFSKNLNLSRDNIFSRLF